MSFMPGHGYTAGTWWPRIDAAPGALDADYSGCASDQRHKKKL